MPHFVFTPADTVSNDEVTVWEDETFERSPFDLMDAPSRAFMNFYEDRDVTTASRYSRNEIHQWADDNGKGLEAFTNTLRT